MVEEHLIDFTYQTLYMSHLYCTRATSIGVCLELFFDVSNIDPDPATKD